MWNAKPMEIVQPLLTAAEESLATFVTFDAFLLVVCDVWFPV